MVVDERRAELLGAWQDALTASKLAERLAQAAAAAASDADDMAAATHEIAVLAEEAAIAAERAARTAREIATRAAAAADQHHRVDVPAARDALTQAAAQVKTAEGRYVDSGGDAGHAS